MKVLILFMVGVFMVSCRAQIACRLQTLTDFDDADPLVVSLNLRRSTFRRRRGPNPFSALLQRSIVQCRSSVEVLGVPDNTTEYEGIQLDAIVTIVETEVPLRNSTQAAQRALPACTGIFISSTQILSSAHCVYHQRQDKGGEPYWMYGDDNPHNTFLYAITGKVNAVDKTFNVYKLVRGCIPQSYIDAENEEVTSVMGNDLVVFDIEGQFVGNPMSIGAMAPSVVYDIAKDYMLPQYPSDFNDGRSLVIDKNTTPIRFESLGSGMFFSIDLASWSGSSGGPIIDMIATRITGRPTIVGVLMSSGWGICDSGIVPVTTGIPIVQELVRIASKTRNANAKEKKTESLPVTSNKPRPEQESEENLTPEEGSPEPFEMLTMGGTEEPDENDILPTPSNGEEMTIHRSPGEHMAAWGYHEE
ncbi:unnamed protein product [Agarophyton chilense]